MKRGWFFLFYLANKLVSNPRNATVTTAGELKPTPCSSFLLNIPPAFGQTGQSNSVALVVLFG